MEICVTDYGVRPDSDPLMDPAVNRAGLQAAADALPSGQGAIRVPYGTFPFAGAAISLQPNTVVYGVDRRHSALLQQASDQEVFTVNVGNPVDKASLTLRQLLLLHRDPGGSAPIIRIERVSLVEIDRCQVKHGAFGLHLTGGMNSLVTDCIFNEQQGPGVPYSAGVYANGVRRLQVTACLATEQGPGAMGFMLHECADADLTQCLATDTYDNSGFKVSGGAAGSVSFHGCQAINCGINGHGPADGFEAQTAQHVQFDACRAVENGRHGFYARNAAWLSYAGCLAVSNGRWAAGNGLYLLHTTDVSVIGCQATDRHTPPTQQIGVEGVGTTDRMLVVGTHLRGNATASLMLCGSASVGADNLT